MNLIASLIELFADLISAVVRADGDDAKQEEALMAAEEKLSRVRAKAKFGG